MQPIDAGYLYDLGAVLRPLRGLGVEVRNAWKVWAMLSASRDAVQLLLTNSIYSGSLRTAHQYGGALVEVMQALINRIETSNMASTVELENVDFLPIMRAFSTFEPVMIAELQSASIFYVPPRGAFDNAHLINAGEKLFPENLFVIVPETLNDIQQGARCLAFNLPTAAGFHFHRANEAVLREYFNLVAGVHNRPAAATMGSMLSKLKKLNLGDKNVIAALDNIREFHRNPLMHPDHTLESMDEAISLYCAIRSAMSYMLEKL